MEKEGNKVFKISWDKKVALYPPEQVFIKDDFKFLLTIGGNLVDNEIGYKKLMTVLKSIGEINFFIVENVGATDTTRATPFIGKLSTDSNFESFQKIGKAFDPIFGWTTSHFFVYGDNDNWGIYMCEYPTINIIGCNKKFVTYFKRIYGIKGNGFEKLKNLISKEFHNKPDLINQLIENYKLES